MNRLVDPPGGWERIDALLRLALEEDIGAGDATTLALGLAEARAEAHYVAREPGIMAGGEVLRRLFGHIDPNGRLAAPPGHESPAVRMDRCLEDGAAFAAGDRLAAVSGPSAAVLAAERTSLNLLQRMCGVAAHTARYVAAARAGTPPGQPVPAILDTRKTCPGHRALDKWAVRAGGGQNHRMGLYDMVLIKDNHLALGRGPAEAARAARKATGLPVMVEVDTLEQLADALPAEPDFALLDNMPPDQLREAVERTRRQCAAAGWRRPLLEASGGVRLETIGAVAAAGVDRISVGALTQGAPTVDIGLDF